MPWHRIHFSSEQKAADEHRLTKEIFAKMAIGKLDDPELALLISECGEDGSTDLWVSPRLSELGYVYLRQAGGLKCGRPPRDAPGLKVFLGPRSAMERLFRDK
jgi:hypothetical protein